MFELVILRIIGIKIVWTAHNLIPHESVSLKGDRLIAKLTAKLSDAVIVHGVHAREKLISTLNLKNHNNIVIIPHGHYICQYDNTIDRASARSRLGINGSKFVVLFLGKVRPYKGTLRLIDAFITLGRDVPDGELVIAGLPLNENFSGVIRDKIAGSENIQYRPGFIHRDEIQVYMNAADVAVFPYRDILTSGAVLLAMSFARACVAPKLCFAKDILDENGAFLYDPGGSDGLLNALKAACAGRENLANMGLHNFRKASQQSWENIAAETNGVYLKCIHG